MLLLVGFLLVSCSKSATSDGIDVAGMERAEKIVHPEALPIELRADTAWAY
jgi:hypothetical protein